MRHLRPGSAAPATASAPAADCAAAPPTSMMVSLLSKKDGVVVMGAPNLSFLQSLKVSTTKLPHHRSKAAAELDKTKIYLTFQVTPRKSKQTQLTLPHRLGLLAVERRGYAQERLQFPRRQLPTQSHCSHQLGVGAGHCRHVPR